MKKLFLLIFLIPLFLFANETDKNDLMEVKKLEDILKETAREAEQKMSEEKTEEKKDKEKKEEQEKKDEIKIKKTDASRELLPEVFNGVLTGTDIFLEKKEPYYYLWVRKKGLISSVGLVTNETSFQSSRRYFLRASRPVPEQKENFINYKGELIGPDNGLYFLSSSKAVPHPILGEAFRIVIPQEIIYGYKSRKRGYGKIQVIPAKTRFLIRTYESRYAQGKFVDNPYLLKEVLPYSGEKSKLELLSRKEKEGFHILEFLYQSPYREIESIALERENESCAFYPVAPKTKDAKETEKAFLLSHWSYHFMTSGFSARFFVILSTELEGNWQLKVKSKGDILVYPILKKEAKESEEKENEKVDPNEETEEKED
jgi:hypothetical protein